MDLQGNENQLTVKISTLQYVKSMVESGKAPFAVLMPDWDKDRFVKIVSSGKKLSQKSTFFYPKPPSGIAIYRP